MEKEKGITLWRQIADLIANSIEKNDWTAGQKLPTEMELAKQYDVNRHTIRRSIGELVERGLVKVEQGRGIFVPEYVLDYKLAQRTRFTELVTRQNKTASGRLLDAELIRPPPEVAKALRINRKNNVFLLRTIREIDTSPITFASHFFPAQRFPDLPEVFKEQGTVSKTLEVFDCGDYERRKTKITARLPTNEEAFILKQARNRPILITESINVDLNDKPIEYGIAAFCADRTQLIVET
ncbi:MAG: phosphonate metabolism transcriptional regulator PhnF [Rhodospirillaceae bacterium]|nr:phosphonate metabolism transcriptional regulator PhnF [Rhodospirillaceae bacterium]|tara:strand:+ start:396 stop:1112 length:717 start_codon:yes stop_codon:yes gene_type:complete